MEFRTRQLIYVFGELIKTVGERTSFNTSFTIISNFLTVDKINLSSVLKLSRNFFHLTSLIDLWAFDLYSRKYRFYLEYYIHDNNVSYNLHIRTRLMDRESTVSVIPTFKSSDWLEREIWDMYGIPFEDNTDLRRILTDYGFEGHPLRKDFPLSGYVEVRFDSEVRRIVIEPVKFTQTFRNFEFTSPWSHTKTI